MSDQAVALVAAEALHSFCCSCFIVLGVPPRHAQVAGDSLVAANLRGVDSHGVIRLKIYADRLRSGSIDPQSPWRVARETGTTALIDGGNGMGQVVSFHAMNRAITMATNDGVGIVGVYNSGHFGMAGYYALMAARRGCIGLAATNTSASMAPWGGREPRLGNNALAIAAPAGSHQPVVLDMATGAAAWGKIFLAQQEKKKIPTTWALDRNGQPTDDPDAAANGGMIQPFGGYKGYGLSFIVDVLTGVLTGAGFSKSVLGLYQGIDKPINAGHTFAAIRIDAFMPLEDFGTRMDELIDSMRGCPPATGVERIYTPGEIEYETDQRRRREGIPIHAALRKELLELANELGVPSL